jgi:hypothetical protein
MNARFLSTATACSMILALTGCGSDDADGAGGTASSSTGTPASVGSGGDGTGATGASGGAGATGGSGAAGGDASGGSGGQDISKIADALDGYRIELPCTDHDPTHYAPGDTCPWDPAIDTNDDPMWALKIENDLTIGGDPNVVYDVQLHVDGVSEPKQYESGTVVGTHLYIGGTEVLNDYNIYDLTVTDPPEVYRLSYNSGGTGHFMIVIDDDITIPMRGGTTVRVGTHDHNDQAIANGVPDTVKGEAGPFAGHLIKLTVLGVTPQ